jgi:hypothetical protein
MRVSITIRVIIAVCHYAMFVKMLSVNQYATIAIMLSVSILSINMLSITQVSLFSVIMLSFILLIVIVLSINTLSINILSVIMLVSRYCVRYA